MSKRAVININNVSKRFVLPHEKINSVKRIFTSFYKRDRTFSTQTALRNVSFDIREGEFFAIAGRNGSGKSTLLKIIAGIYQPTQGSVGVRGRLVPFIELGVGFNPELTGRENVYLNGAILGFSKKQIDEYYDDVVDFAELEAFMDQKLKNYSSGMQVRLAFACATRAEADILLVDEVLAVGDADFQRKCFDFFRELKKKKKTVVFVSHDMGSVREYCDRGILIEDSQIILSGTADEIADEYIRLFIPSTKSKKDTENKINKRVGSKKVEFIKINTTKSITSSTKKIAIELDCISNEDVESVNIGFKLKDPTGKPLIGTNSEIAGNKIRDLKAGERHKYRFTFDNILNEGKYSLDIVAESIDGDMYDWWVDCTTLQVYKEKKTGYPIEPKIGFDIRGNA